MYDGYEIFLLRNYLSLDVFLIPVIPALEDRDGKIKN